MGTRLRTLKKKMGKTLLSDKKPIGGTNRLTDKMMNKMQCYFGQAIRGNTGSIYQMKKAIWAILWHCSVEGTPSTRHQFCPRDDGTWCRDWKFINRCIPIEQYKEKGGGRGGGGVTSFYQNPTEAHICGFNTGFTVIKMLARKHTE